MELRAVAVGAVALVPLLVLAQRVVDAQPVPAAPSALQRRFDHRREQQPVVEARHDRRVDSSAAIRWRSWSIVEPSRARPRRAQQPLREERGVDQRLALAREVHEVRRCRIDRAGDRARARAAHTCPRRALRPSRPRGSSSHGAIPAISRPSASRCVTDRRDRRRLPARPASAFQRPVRQVGQHRVREALEHAHPVGTIGGRRLESRRRRLEAERRRRHDRGHRPQKLASIHAAMLPRPRATDSTERHRSGGATDLTEYTDRKNRLGL